jgi:uncharacterized Fe-S center protein
MRGKVSSTITDQESERTHPMVAVLDCKGCGTCDNVCPFGAIEKVGKITRINYDKCTGCLKCVECCPNKALVVMD